jgi:hypothetical protein
VMTDQSCFDDKDGFAKLDRWPALRNELETHYTSTVEWHPSVKQRWWSRSEFPHSFRLYVGSSAVGR